MTFSLNHFGVLNIKIKLLILTKQMPKGKKAVVVPNHKEIDKGTLLEIIRQAGLTRDEFLELV